MRRLRIFRDWKPSKPCDFDYKNYKIVNDDSYEYAIIYNTPKPNLTIPKENVIGFAYEPSSMRNYKSYESYAKKHIGCYIVHVDTNLAPPFSSYHTFMCNTNWVGKTLEKKHPLCMIFSHKRNLPGHKLRHQLVKEILKTDIDVHLWGTGIRHHKCSDERIKGEGAFASHEKVFPNYYFDISIENSIEGRYVSEKFNNPIINETVPIYWGSKYASEMYNDCFLEMPSSIPETIALLSKISADPLKFYNQKRDALMITKNNLLETNCIDIADRFFNSGKFDPIVL